MYDVFPGTADTFFFGGGQRGAYIYGDVVVFNFIMHFHGYNTVDKRIFMLLLIV